MSKINAHISILGEDGKPKKQASFKQITLSSTIAWIKSLNMDSEITQELIKIASNYPTPALPSIRSNINVLIAKIKNNITKKEDLGDKHEIIKEQDQPKTKQKQEKPSKKSISAEDLL